MWKPAFSNARTDAMLRSSGSATQDVVSPPGEHDLVDEPAEDLGAEPLPGELLLADEDVDSRRSRVGYADLSAAYAG